MKKRGILMASFSKELMRLKAKVNSNCIACGLCASMCPEVFNLNETGFASTREDKQIDPALEPTVKEAADGCPVDAIELA